MTKSPAYSELYLKDAQENIAWAFEYGVLGLGFSLETFVKRWLSLKYIDLIVLQQANESPNFTPIFVLLYIFVIFIERC